MKAAWGVSALLAASVAMAACGDSASGSKAAKKADGKPWDGAGSTFAAPGWKQGDKASWDEQMRLRAQSQNEYTRVP